MIQELKQWALGFLFPSFCVSCRTSGEWWCEDCRQSVQKNTDQICPACLSMGDHECAGTLPFKQVWSLGYYHDPKLRSAITALKFNGTSALKDDLRKFVSDRLPVLPEGAVMIPMPLAEKRLKERGFNQAELIAALIGNFRTDCLIRSVHRDPQSSMAHDLVERGMNIRHCFKTVGDVPKNIILIDDVITTGATAAEAARVLLSAGAETVSVLTLAIGA
ncbi:MAG: hypothetical protein PHC70_02670 [Patescibacteria group bacterium]|nr:hypothetical protein [Patescibacteria group bacterium]